MVKIIFVYIACEEARVQR